MLYPNCEISEWLTPPSMGSSTLNGAIYWKYGHVFSMLSGSARARGENWFS